jgi:serine/threonine protein kinase
MENQNEYQNIQEEIYNSLKKKYIIEKYLGTKDNNRNYLVNDVNNNFRKYVIQIRPINKLTNESISQIVFLNYLSKFQSSKKYIRPCLDYGITEDKIIMVHQFNQEESLSEYLEKIKDYKQDKYLELIIKIITQILYGLTYIHKKEVVHQNFDFENILIKIDENHNMGIIFTDFQYSCGNYLSEKDKKIHNHICSPKVSPSEDVYKTQLLDKIEKIIKTENNSLDNNLAYLYLAKKYDIYLLGVLFWKMVNRYQVGINPVLIEFDHNNLSYRGIKHLETEKIHNFIVKKMLSKIPYRLKAKELLDELLIKTKYNFM